jgi:hypothetical protein
MFIRFFTCYLLLLLLVGCTEDSIVNNSSVAYPNTFVSKIDFSNKLIYEIKYEENKVACIVTRFFGNEDNTPTWVDSTLFLYKNKILDSAIIYRYKKNFLPIKTIDNYTQPIGILYSAHLGINSVRDTIHLNYVNNQNKVILQKSDRVINVIGPESNTQKDLFQIDFLYDEHNRLIALQPNNQTLQYNYFDNVELNCVNNICTQYWKYDNNINPFKAINDKLGIPYFLEGLSRNNPLLYVSIHKKENPILMNNHYQYDDKGRPVRINGNITIEYRDH